MRMRVINVSEATRTVFSRSTQFPWQRVTAVIRVVPERAARNLCGVRPAIQVREVKLLVLFTHPILDRISNTVFKSGTILGKGYNS